VRFVHLALMCFLLPLGISQAEKIWKSRSKKSQHTEKFVAVFFFSSISLWSFSLWYGPAKQVQLLRIGTSLCSAEVLYSAVLNLDTGRTYPTRRRQSITLETKNFRL